MPTINKYRRANGVSEVSWYDLDFAVTNAIEKYANANERQKQKWRNSYPNAFNADGSINEEGMRSSFVESVEESQLVVRNSLEYCIVHETLAHGNDYGATCSTINGSGDLGYKPAEWIEDTKDWEGHWASLMRAERTSVYCCFVVHSSGVVTFCIN